ncbi:MAG: HugZ family protein [Sandaracinaceae bacterium]
MSDDHGRPTREEPLTDPDVSAPSHAERARTFARSITTGALATVGDEGYPHASYVTFALYEADPIFLISTLASHTQHIVRDPRASLLVHESSHPDPLANSRLTLIGDVERLDDPGAARASYLAAHPSASYYADFEDFAFWRLRVARLRYIGGYGRMSWVDVDAWRSAEVDPLAEHAPGILTHMNDDHADACLAYARAFTRAKDATTATMTAVDRYGFELSVATERGPRPARIAFDDDVTTPDGARKALVALVKKARAAST